jgi:hypothetical protein
MRVPIAISILLLAAQASRADALTDLRATLSQFAATAAARGVFEVESTSTDSDDPQASQGKASVGFEIDDAGLRVLYPKATLIQASQEARAEASDPDRQSPVRSGVGRVHALQLADLLNASSMLMTELISAQLIETKTATYRGKPSRLVALKLSPKMSKGESKHIKKIDSTLSVWLAEDGVPIGAERVLSIKASFMLLSFDHAQTEKWDYARSGDRLIAVRYEEDEKSGGMGQHSASHVIEAVRLQP